MDKSRIIAASDGFICTLAIWIFSLFIQRESGLHYFAYAGLLLAAFIISRSIPNFSALFSAFGISPFRRKTLNYIIAGLVLGLLLAFLNKTLSGVPVFPSILTKFTIIAALIGITEELVFRGYVQAQMAPAGTLASIVIASAGHTVYKYLIIKTLPDELQVNYPLLVLLTFGIGIILGILRDRSKNILPPALAHAVFDIIVYGGFQSAPLWVW
jgi:membrane protease YdiL (CAAX protease family)